mgnify:CR=1 FL=1
MSLINDALKRARTEASRQDAASRGVDYRAVPAHSRRSPWSAGQLAGWTVAAIAIGLLLWVTLRPAARDASGGPGEVIPETSGASTAGGVAVPPASRPEAPAPPGPASGEPALVEPAAAEGVPPTAAEPPSVTTGPLSGPVSPADREPEAGAPATGAPTREAPEADPAASRGARAVVDGRLVAGTTYVRRATSADGGSVELGGIAYSQERPIAVLNGAVVAPGDMIAGFTVVGIEPERVELEVDGVRIYLSLR